MLRNRDGSWDSWIHAPEIDDKKINTLDLGRKSPDVFVQSSAPSPQAVGHQEVMP